MLLVFLPVATLAKDGWVQEGIPYIVLGSLKLVRGLAAFCGFSVLYYKHSSYCSLKLKYVLLALREECRGTFRLAQALLSQGHEKTKHGVGQTLGGPSPNTEGAF